MLAGYCNAGRVLDGTMLRMEYPQLEKVSIITNWDSELLVVAPPLPHPHAPPAPQP